MYKGLLLALVLLIPLAGCGVNKDIHEAVVQESALLSTQLEATKGEVADLKETLAQRETRIVELETEVAVKEKQLASLSMSGDEALQEIEKMQREIIALKREKAEVVEEAESLRLQIEDVKSEKEMEAAETKSTYESLIGELQGEISRGEVKITRAVDRLTVNLVDKILFDSGQTEIKGAGLEVLARLGEILKEVQDKQIRIEGHTDNVPIGGGKLRKNFPTNWELSTRRATNVVRYLQEKVGIDPTLLSASGYSEFRPVAANDTAESMAENRRIEIVLLPVDVKGVLEELTQ